jgi:DNA-directed RNA polymerase alpha subunit
VTEGQAPPPIPPEFRHFTPRTARALVRGGYRRLDEVRAASDEELLGLRNFGYLSLDEVRGRAADPQG